MADTAAAIPVNCKNKGVSADAANKSIIFVEIMMNSLCIWYISQKTYMECTLPVSVLLEPVYTNTK